MSTNSIGRNVAILAACGVLFLLVHWASQPSKASAAGDARAGIEKLHQQDVAATLAGDPKALADLFTDDAVLLEPGDAPVLGKPAILAGNQKQHAAQPDAKVLSYKPEVRDLQIRDGWAFEWDTFEASFRESANGEVKNFRGKGLRVLQREPDGSWKFARVMWNLAESQ